MKTYNEYICIELLKSCNKRGNTLLHIIQPVQQEDNALAPSTCSKANPIFEQRHSKNINIPYINISDSSKLNNQTEIFFNSVKSNKSFEDIYLKLYKVYSLIKK